jgi:glutathione S-transferase
MNLHDCAMAPNPRRARLFLAEKGIAWPAVQVDLRAPRKRFAHGARAVQCSTAAWAGLGG